MTAMNLRKFLWLAALAALVGACTAAGGGGGGGPSGVGGAPGQQCDPALFDQGCFGKARMQCDPATKAWVQIEICGDGLACSENNVSGAPLSMRKTECKKFSGPIVGGGGDVSGGDSQVGADGQSSDANVNTSDTTGKGDLTGPTDTSSATDVVTDPDTAGDIAKDTVKEVVIVADTATTAKFSDCLAKACVEEWSSCGADTTCVTFLTCAGGCKDSACVTTCAQKNFSEATVVLSSCAGTSGCMAAGSCGNGKCDSGETASSCPSDCAKPVCGNGKCETGETATSCKADCATTTDCCKQNSFNCGFASKCGKNCGTCPSGQACTANMCQGSTPDTCLEDNCGGEISACQNNEGCAAIWVYAILGNCAQKFNCQDNQCVQTNCGKEMQQCQQMADCTKLITCLSTCKDDQACANKCPTATGLQLYQDLGDCAQSFCP